MVVSVRCEKKNDVESEGDELTEERKKTCVNVGEGREKK